MGSLDALVQKAEDFGKTSFELYKLKLIDKSSDLFSSLVAHLAVYVMVLISLLLLSTAFSVWLGEKMGKIHYGFIICGIFYFIVSLLLYKFRKSWIKKPINNSLVKNAIN